jgi:hypothetical protein
MGRPLLLLEAAYCYRANGEDRLTELFAAALDVHPGFCRALLERLMLPAGERYFIPTQHRLGAASAEAARPSSYEPCGALASRWRAPTASRGGAPPSKDWSAQATAVNDRSREEELSFMRLR